MLKTVFSKRVDFTAVQTTAFSIVHSFDECRGIRCR